MNRLFLTQLFSVLYFSNVLVLFAIVISLKTESINNNDDNKPQNDQQEQKRPHISILHRFYVTKLSLRNKKYDGWNDVSFHGSDQIPTPNIDAISYNGIILNNHYVPPLCTPSRSALLTGKDPIHLGMQHHVLSASEARGLPLNEKLLSEYLKEAGYKTHLVGKWHLGYYKREYTPTYRSFDSHFGYWNGVQDYYDHTTIEPVSDSYQLQGFDMRRNLSVAWDTIGKYSTDLFTEEAVRLINTHDINDPMFLYLAHLAPHSGNINQLLQAPAEEIAKFSYIENPERRVYAAMVSKLDQGIGEVMVTLRNREMLKNSIILFMSDNGAPTLGFMSNHGSNYPLRGIKNTPWEDAMRGVATLWSPLIKRNKRVSNQLMFMTDWLPTLLSAIVTKNPCCRHRQEKNPSRIDGYDMWTALTRSDNISHRDEVLLNIDDIDGYEAIRLKNFKYVNGKSKIRFNWIGDSGRISSEERPWYDPEKVLHSKAGVSIASAITAGQVLKQRSRTNKQYVAIKRSAKSTLTPEKIVQLRKQAEIHCNVTEEEKIPCDLSVSPCLFDIEKDPCEMRNIIKQQPTTAKILKIALNSHRLNMVPPSNKDADPRAHPKYWNNTWTCWLDSEHSL